MHQPWLPLDGITVVDFSMFVPGPFCSAIFADLDGVPHVRLPWTLDSAPLPWTRRAPRLGEHTSEVLRESGVDEGVIAAMEAAR